MFSPLCVYIPLAELLIYVTATLQVEINLNALHEPLSKSNPNDHIWQFITGCGRTETCIISTDVSFNGIHQLTANSICIRKMVIIDRAMATSDHSCIQRDVCLMSYITTYVGENMSAVFMTDVWFVTGPKLICSEPWSVRVECVHARSDVTRNLPSQKHSVFIYHLENDRWRTSKAAAGVRMDRIPHLNRLNNTGSMCCGSDDEYSGVVTLTRLLELH